MKILEFLEEDKIIPSLKSKTKEDALKEMIHQLSIKARIDEKYMFSVIKEREKLGSTGIGEGVAIPHAKAKGIENILACLARSKKGIDFQSIDGKPSHIFFLLITPESSAGNHLKALARISRLLKNNTFRERLMNSSDSEEIFSLFAEEDKKYD